MTRATFDGVRPARAGSILAVPVLGSFLLLCVAFDALAETPAELFSKLTDNAMKIVAVTEKVFGADAMAACKAGRTKVNEEVKRATKALRAKGALTGASGFYQLEAENYYARNCGRKFRK